MRTASKESECFLGVSSAHTGTATAASPNVSACLRLFVQSSPDLRSRIHDASQCEFTSATAVAHIKCHRLFKSLLKHRLHQSFRQFPYPFSGLPERFRAFFRDCASCSALIASFLVMPRSRSSRPSRPRPSAPAVVRPPAPAPPPAVQQVQPGMMRGMGGAIAEGMAFGGGSAVAHRAIDAVIGPRTVHHEVTQVTSTAPAAPGATGAGQSQEQEPDVCVNQAKAFKDCLKANANDIGKCQFYVDMLTQCRKSAGVETSQSDNW